MTSQENDDVTQQHVRARALCAQGAKPRLLIKVKFMSAVSNYDDGFRTPDDGV